MKRSLSLLLLIALVLGLAGCGSGQLNSFTWFVEQIPTNLDPQIAQESADVIACTHLYAGLLRTGADGTLEPACAESYTVSADGLRYTFTLRQGLSYRGQRGAATTYAITAQDFLFAFQRVFRAETASPYAASFAAIANSSAVLAGTMPESALGVSAPDEYTLVIQLSVQDDNFLQKLTLPGAMPCDEEFFLSTQGTYGLTRSAVITSGSFYLYNWTNSGLFARREANGSQINNLRLVQNTDATGQTPAQLVENERCTAALDTSAEPTTLGQLTYTDTTWCLVFDQNEDSPFANADLRRALCCSAQSVALPAQTALYTAAQGIVPEGAEVDGLDYRAAAGDANATLGDGSEAYALALQSIDVRELQGISLLVPQSLDADYVQALNARWQADYSLFFNIETVADDVFASRYAAGDYTLALAPVTLTQSDPLTLLQSLSGGANGYADSSYTLLMQQAAAATGQQKLLALAQAERILTADCVVTPLFAQQKRLLVAPTVSGLQFTPFGPLIDVTWATRAE